MNNKNNLFISKSLFWKNHFIIFFPMLLLCLSNTASSQFKENYDSLLSIYHSSKLNEDTNKVMILYELALFSAKANIQGYKTLKYELKEPGAYYSEALMLSIKLNYNNGIELYYQTIAAIFNQNTETPIIGYDQSDDEVSRKNFKELYIYRNKKHFGSLDTYIRELELLKINGIDQKGYRLEFWIGLIYFDWGNYNKAIEHFKKAYQYNAITLEDQFLSDLYQCLGVAFFYKGDLDTSIYYLNKSFRLIDKQETKSKAGICLINLAEVYYSSANYNEASMNFKKSISYLTSDSAYHGYALIRLGTSCLSLKIYADAEKYLSESYPIICNLKDKNLLVHYYRIKAELYEKIKTFQNALYFRKKYQQLKDSLFLNEVSWYFHYYEDNWQNAIGREISKKESEALKKGETIIALNKTRLILIFMGLIILTVLLISIYTYRLYRLKQNANVYLSELNKSKEQLLSIISHDVRGPIIGFIDLLEPLNQQIDILSHGQISSHLDNIIVFAQGIRLLLDNLLEWTKTQHGLMIYRPEIFSLSEIVDPNINFYSQVAKIKGISLKSDIPSGIKILADRNMMMLILRNLINNAVKFTERNGMICLKSEKNKEFVTVTVSDTGIGIDNELIAFLFGENEPPREQNTWLRKSTGLGLLLCREYITKCGGKIWATSKGKNYGSQFFFTVILAEQNEKD